MSLYPDDLNSPPPARRRTHARLRKNGGQEVAALLLGKKMDVEIPSIAELTAATTALASGVRHKVLLPLARTPVEFALLRRGDEVLVSCYGTASAPVVYQLDHRVSLRKLLDVCARATLESARYETDPTARQIAVRVAERALRTQIQPDPDGEAEAINQRGGVLEPNKAPLAFGFEASIVPATATATARSTRADVHAILFNGTLWGFANGKRMMLAKGPIMLAAHRMVVAIRALVDAWDAGRTAHVKLRAGNFMIGVRINRSQEVDLSIGSDGEQKMAASNLSVKQAALPVLRLVSDLLRSLVSADRNQSKNLRVRMLREEVRRLRREIKSRTRVDSFVNTDPDRLRIDSDKAYDSTPPPAGPARSLRFEERWKVSIENLDANSVFMCGDRLVLATPSHVIAISRDNGDVIWARPGTAVTTLMAGTVLIRVLAEGEVELCDVETGEAYATTRIAPRIGGTTTGLMMGGGAFPPVAVLTEGSHRLVAIDVRTGEPRWRFASRTGGEFRLRRIGRILLVACGEGAIHAIDATTGEDAWRFSSANRFAYRPAVCGETVIAASSQGSRGGEAFGIDLYTGRMRWTKALPAPPSANPLCAGPVALIATSKRDRQRLTAYDPMSGRIRWESEDPGLGLGGATLTVDDAVVTNAPAGRVCSVDLRTGATLWDCELADPVGDDIPRRLEPVLRGGALFVPSSAVHVIRPQNGALMSSHIPSDLIPDLIRVDERGWLYIAEESGQLVGLAPKTQLTLIPGGS